MSKRFFALLFALATFASSSFATDKSFTSTGNASNDFALGANWTGGVAPGGGDRAFLTNNTVVANQTNIAYRNGNYTMFGAANVGLVVSNSNAAGTGIRKFLLNSGFFEQQGMVIGNNGIVSIGLNATNAAYSQFTLNTGGTLIFAGANSYFRLGGESVAGLTINGNLVGNAGAGNTATFNGNSTGAGGDSFFVVGSGGKIIANSGTLMIDPDDAFSNDGLTVNAGGIIQINAGATLLLNRTVNAWDTDSNPDNLGTIWMNGGTFATVRAGGAINNTMTFDNQGLIIGNGTLNTTIRNDSPGTLVATGGVLSVFRITGASGSFNATNAGTLNLFGGHTGGSAGTITGSILVTNSSAIIFSGGTDWQINGTTKIGFAGATAAQRGSLISSNSGVASTLFLNSNSLIENNGTLLIVGGAGQGINFGQLAAPLTNNFVMSGNGSFTGVFGGNSIAILNLGTISTVNGGLLSLVTSNAFSFGGVQNAVGGTIQIVNNSTLNISRSDLAWFTDSSPTNLGTVLMQGGTLIASNMNFGTGALDGGKFVNAAGGVISITGAVNNITNFRVLQNNGLISLGATSSVTVTLNSGGTFDNRGGVVQLNGTGSLSGPGANVFSVNGNYISDSTSAITNTVGSAALLFTGVTAVTNNGTISFLSGFGGVGGSGAAGNTNAMILVGSSAANFFQNSGTLIFGTRSNAAARTFVISNQFVNTGTFIITNAAVLGAGGQPIVTIVGSTRVTGGASTNTATGTIRLVNEATLGAGSANAGTITFLNGDFVNLGTVTYNTTTNSTTSWTLSEAGAVFSNAAAGHIIMESGMIGAGDLSFRSEKFVNAGTMVLSNSAGASGTAAINIQNTASANTNLLNSGTILFGGGILNAALFTNTATGLIQGNGTFGGTASRLNVNAGTIRASGGLLFMGNVTNSSQIIATPGSSLRLLDLSNGGTGVLTSDNANVTIAGTTTNSGTMTFLNSSVGTFTGAARSEAGAVIRANTSILSFNSSGVFTNLGTVGYASSVGVYSGSVYNAGIWTLNQSTNRISSNLTVAATGTRSLTGSVDLVSANLSIEAGGVYELFNASSITANGQYTNAGNTTLRSSWGFFFFNAINSGAYLSDASTSFISLGLTNTAAGSMIFSNGSLVSVVGGANSAGRMAFISSVGTFGGSVLNGGVWTESLSTNNIGANLTVNGTGTRSLTGSVDIVGGNASVAAGGLYEALSASKVSVAGLFTNAGSTILRGSSVGTFTGAAVNTGNYQSDSSTDWFAGSLLNGTTGSMSFSNNSVWFVGGDMTNLGTVNVHSSSAQFNGDVYDSGVWEQDPSTNNFGGNLTVNGTRTLITSVDNVGGKLFVTSTGNYSLTQTSRVNVAGVYTNAGITRLIQSSIGTYSSAAVNSGTYISDLSSNVFGSTLLNTAAGTVVLTNSSHLNVASTLTNGGIIRMDASSIAAGSTTNTGTISGNGSISGRLFNAGLVEATNSTLQLLGRATGAGAYRAVGGANPATLTFSGDGSISALFNTGATIRVESTLTNAGAVYVNAGTLAVVGNSYVNQGNLINIASGVVSGNVGQILVSGVTTNSGLITLLNSSGTFVGAVANQSGAALRANDSQFVFNGVMTNAGAVSFLNSVGTFTAGAINSGAWITDSSTNIFQNTLTVTSSGSISMTSGDVMIFTNGATASASFINLSTQSNTFDTTAGKFLFDNTLGMTQDFLVAGLDFGPYPSTPILTATNALTGIPPVQGFITNFALGTFEISNFTTVRVDDAFLGLAGWGANDNRMAGLYVNNLILGQDSFLIISTNVQVYFNTSNTWGSANYILDGNPTYNNTYNGLHQLLAVPEPNILMLLVVGGVAMMIRRNRRRKLA